MKSKDVTKYQSCTGVTGRFMVFNSTFNRENHRSAASHWQTLSHNIVASTPRNERDANKQL